jgi:hypothetical protein
MLNRYAVIRRGWLYAALRLFAAVKANFTSG